MIFNLDHEMETLHFISNGEDPYPTMVVTVKAIILNLIITYYYMFGTKRGRERKEKKKKNTHVSKREEKVDLTSQTIKYKSKLIIK